MKRITIHDIAKAVNKSSGTVSKALANHPSISEKTKNMVVSYARTNNFKYNTTAQLLRRGNSKIIGFITPTINLPFVSELLSYVEEKIQVYGYRLLVMQSKYYELIELELVDSGIRMGLDGLILICIGVDKDLKRLDYLKSGQYPIAILTRDVLKFMDLRYEELNETLRSEVKTMAKNIGYFMVEELINEINAEK
jgi:LacI family transcriptional regulator